MLVSEFLERSAARLPDKTALVCGKKHFTFGELQDLSRRLARKLVRQGIKKQDRVVIYLENSWEAVVAVFAALKLGGVFVVINPLVKKQKLAYILNDCEAALLVTDPVRLKNIGPALGACGSLRAVVCTYALPEPKDRPQGIPTLSLPALLEESSEETPFPRVIDIDLASLIYTSGSTGIPKGVMMTHHNMVSAADSVIEYLENREDDIILSVLPLAFDYGLYQLLMAVRFGGTLVLEKSFAYPFQVIDRLIKEEATGFPLVPTMAAILLRLSDLDKYDFSHVRYITNTAQALPAAHIRRLREIFPFTRIYSMYGLTECKRVSYLPPEELDNRPTSVGKAMPNTETYIVGEKGERITQPGEIGELVVRGASVMRGYWKLREETEAVLKPGPIPGERVLYTGDLFKMDEEGFLYFVARKDDMLKVSGERVSPKEIENVLHGMEAVSEAAVIGVPDPLLGQAVMAFVALEQQAACLPEAIERYCSLNMESFMVPKYIAVLDELPRTSNGKVDKLALSERSHEYRGQEAGK